MNKKIAFLTNGFADKNFSSGGLKLNFMLIQKLIDNGYCIDVYAKRFYTECDTAGITPHVFEDFNPDEKYDFVLSGNAIFPADVTYIHDHTNIFRFKHMYGPIMQKLYKIFNKKSLNKRLQEDRERQEILNNTKKIIVSSEILKLDYINNYKLDENKFEIIQPPITLESSITVQPASPPPPTNFIFGLCAVGFERKGGYITLDAAAKLKRTIKNFKIKIIYPKKNLLIRYLIFVKGLKNNIEIINFQKDMTNFYNEIDCLLMPSKVEPFGMVATEAMSHKKPAIVSKLSGAADLIKPGFNGFIVDNEENFSENLTKVMKTIVEMPKDEYKEISKNAFLSVKDLDISRFLTRYLNVMYQTKK